MEQLGDRRLARRRRSREEHCSHASILPLPTRRSASTSRVEIAVEGMTCEHCETSVTAALRAAGATNAVADFRRGQASANFGTGPGWVMTQTRNPSALAAWIKGIMPGETGGASGVIGGFLGGR